MTREEAVIEVFREYSSEWNNTEEAASDVLAAADAHDAAHGIHRTKTTRLPDEVGQWYASVTSGMVVESVMGMLTGERSEWFYAQNGPWIKIDLDSALEERLLSDATVERAARRIFADSGTGKADEWVMNIARRALAAAVEAGQ